MSRRSSPSKGGSRGAWPDPEPSCPWTSKTRSGTCRAEADLGSGPTSSGQARRAGKAPARELEIARGSVRLQDATTIPAGTDHPEQQAAIADAVSPSLREISSPQSCRSCRSRSGSHSAKRRQLDRQPERGGALPPHGAGAACRAIGRFGSRGSCPPCRCRSSARAGPRIATGGDPVPRLRAGAGGGADEQVMAVAGEALGGEVERGLTVTSCGGAARSGQSTLAHDQSCRHHGGGRDLELLWEAHHRGVPWRGGLNTPYPQGLAEVLAGLVAAAWVPLARQKS